MNEKKIAGYVMPILAIFVLTMLQCKSAVEVPGVNNGNWESLSIPAGQAVTTDGVAAGGEWTDARKIVLNIPGRNSAEFLIKHDRQNLMLLFYPNNPDASDVLFPEILIDPHDDKSAAWLGDDRWFHVSGSDCDAVGSPDRYDNCQVHQADWTAEPNYPTDSAGTVACIEIVIPFAKAGIVSGGSFGLALCVTAAQGFFRAWPEGASKLSPYTWSQARCSE